MNISSDHAQNLLNTFDQEILFASQFPEFSSIDVLRNSQAVSETWFYQEGNNTLLYTFHRERIPGTQFYDIQSPYPFGGPLCNTEDESFIARANEEFCEWCRTNAIVVEFVRFHPVNCNWRFFRGRIVEDRWTVWMDLTIDDLFLDYETRVRTAVRKAERNELTVRWSNSDKDAAAFYEIYTDTMLGMGADPYYLFPAGYFESLLRWPKAELALCVKDGKVVSGAIFLRHHRHVEYHLSATLSEARNLCANNLILHQAALRAKESGAQKLYLGGGTDADPKNPLLFFKSGFSSHRSMFKYGSRLHMPREYEALKDAFSEKYEKHTSRVLFYRS